MQSPRTSIQIGPYSIPLSSPHSSGQPKTAEEAKVLNSVRADRIRNIGYKRLGKYAKGPDGLLLPSDLRAFQLEMAQLDQEFSFAPHVTKQLRPASLNADIRATAREVALERYRAEGLEPSEGELEGAIDALSDDPKVVEEAQRRFLARQEVAKQALRDLME